MRNALFERSRSRRTSDNALHETAATPPEVSANHVSTAPPETLLSIVLRIAASTRPLVTDVTTVNRAGVRSRSSHAIGSPPLVRGVIVRRLRSGFHGKVDTGPDGWRPPGRCRHRPGSVVQAEDQLRLGDRVVVADRADGRADREELRGVTAPRVVVLLEVDAHDPLRVQRFR